MTLFLIQKSPISCCRVSVELSFVACGFCRIVMIIYDKMSMYFMQIAIDLQVM